MNDSLLSWANLIAMVGCLLGIWTILVDHRRHRRLARLSVRRAVVLASDGGIYEVIALRIENRGELPITFTTVGAYLNRLHGDFLNVDAIDFKGEPVVMRIESGDALTLRIPFETFRGVKAGNLHSFFVRLPDETEYHVRIGRQMNLLAVAGAKTDQESFGDTIKVVTLRNGATDEEVCKAEKALKTEYQKYRLRQM